MLGAHLLNAILRPSPARKAAERIHEAAGAASRQPALYGPERTPDTMDGRFEILVLHGALALLRLHADAKAEPIAQAFANRLFMGFDEGLREAGIGDLAVPKRMKILAKSFYGRIAAYNDALQRQDSALAEALSRNVWNVEKAPFAGALAAYARNVHEALALQPVDALERPESWPKADL